jgi:hypothetical protein
VVYAIGSETVRPTYVVYYHVVYVVGSGLKPTYVVYYHVVYVIDSELLDPHM